MELNIGIDDYEKISKQIAKDVIDKIGISQLRNEVVNMICKEIKAEIMGDKETQLRIEDIFKRCEKSIDDRIHNSITKKLNNLDFQIKLK